MGPLIKFWSLPRREKQLFCEAFTLLLLSHLSIKTIAFRHINNFLRAHWNERDKLPSVGDLRLVNLSLARAANRLPWKCLCLSRSIAAFIMLRRRGIPSVMFVGAKFEGSSLHAHAWIYSRHGVFDGKLENAAFPVLISIGQESVDR
jgi:hypothetical protein